MTTIGLPRHGTIEIRQGSVAFRIQYRHRPGCQKHWVAWVSRIGKKYDGVRPLPEHFRTSADALQALTQKHKPRRKRGCVHFGSKA